MTAKFNQIFYDFDGVICDSNSIKGKNIYKAASSIMNKKDAAEFADFFTKNNGIPREKKIVEYFENEEISKTVLDRYNSLNKNLNDALLLTGLTQHLEKYSDREKFVLSGGSRLEIESYLKKNDLNNFFVEILCGPKTKEENLSQFKIKYPAIFIGDSLHDYEVALKFNLKFVFMYEATQLTDWEKNKFENTIITKNFSTLTKFL